MSVNIEIFCVIILFLFYLIFTWGYTICLLFELNIFKDLSFWTSVLFNISFHIPYLHNLLWMLWRLTLQNFKINAKRWEINRKVKIQRLVSSHHRTKALPTWFLSTLILQYKCISNFKLDYNMNSFQCMRFYELRIKCVQSNIIRKT